MATLRIPMIMLAAAGVLAAAEPGGEAGAASRAESGLDRAEVRIPYPDLENLIQSEQKRPEPELEPALLSAHLRLSVGTDRMPVIEARLRAVRFSDRLSLVPLIGGEVALESHDPPEARLLVRDKMICHAAESSGEAEIGARLRGLGDDGEFHLVLPPCPTSILETGELAGNSGVAVSWAGHRRTMGTGQRLILPPSPGVLTIRLLPKAPEPEKKRRLPVVATADAVVRQAQWGVQVEPDGALLAEGMMSVEHQNPQPMQIDTPEGMTLLACHVDGRAVQPTDLGKGKLEVPLPPPAKNGKQSTAVALSFTGRTEAFDPLEGAFSLTLPSTPLFIHTLSWIIELPDGYQAETHGNVLRVGRVAKESPSTIHLRKNLCRDERPEVRIFYHRADIRP